MNAIPVRKAIIASEKNIVNLYGLTMAKGIAKRAIKKKRIPKPILMEAYV